MRTREGSSNASVRRGRRVICALVALGTGAVPVTALASPVNPPIADGFYVPVVTPGVPGGEELSLSIVHHAIRTMELTCFPNDAVAQILHGSRYANVFILPPVARIRLVDGRFHYSGLAAVSSAPRLADRVGTARFTVAGTFLSDGPSYHYFSALDNEVTSTLVVRGTATTNACVGLPADRVFRLYVTRG